MFVVDLRSDMREDPIDYIPGVQSIKPKGPNVISSRNRHNLNVSLNYFQCI